MFVVKGERLGSILRDRAEDRAEGARQKRDTATRKRTAKKRTAKKTASAEGGGDDG